MSAAVLPMVALRNALVPLVGYIDHIVWRNGSPSAVVFTPAGWEAAETYCTMFTTLFDLLDAHGVGYSFLVGDR